MCASALVNHSCIHICFYVCIFLCDSLVYALRWLNLWTECHWICKFVIMPSCTTTRPVEIHQYWTVPRQTKRKSTPSSAKKWRLQDNPWRNRSQLKFTTSQKTWSKQVDWRTVGSQFLFHSYQLGRSCFCAWGLLWDLDEIPNNLLTQYKHLSLGWFDMSCECPVFISPRSSKSVTENISSALIWPHFKAIVQKKINLLDFNLVNGKCRHVP